MLPSINYSRNDFQKSTDNKVKKEDMQTDWA